MASRSFTVGLLVYNLMNQDVNTCANRIRFSETRVSPDKTTERPVFVQLDIANR